MLEGGWKSRWVRIAKTSFLAGRVDDLGVATGSLPLEQRVSNAFVLEAP